MHYDKWKKKKNQSQRLHIVASHLNDFLEKAKLEMNWSVVAKLGVGGGFDYKGAA